MTVLGGIGAGEEESSRCVAILGGTNEAAGLAAELVRRSRVRVLSTLPGRGRHPRRTVGEVRVGGFGGPRGLADWLVAEGVTAVVDATHPFADRISAAAVKAARYTGIPLVLLRPTGRTPVPGEDWHVADSLVEAAAMLPSLGTRVFLTIGRHGLAAFARSDRWFLIRCADRPGRPLPARKELILAPGPETAATEAQLMTTHDIDLLVTRDAGGDHTAPTLTAAAELRLPVVVVRGHVPAGTPVVATVDEALAWLGTAVPS